MSETVTKPDEIAVIGKLVPNEGRYLISISKDYAADLQKITSRRVMVRVSPLV